MKFKVIEQWRIISDDQIVHRDSKAEADEDNTGCCPEQVWTVMYYHEEAPEGEVICDCYGKNVAEWIVRTLYNAMRVRIPAAV